MKKYMVRVPSDVVAFWFEILESGALSPDWDSKDVTMSDGELFERYIQWGGTARLTPARLSMFINQMCSMDRFPDKAIGCLWLVFPRLFVCRRSFNEYEDSKHPAAVRARWYGHRTKWEHTPVPAWEGPAAAQR